jgi:hypothetical protein
MRGLALAAFLTGCSSGPVLTKQLAMYIAHQHPPLSSTEIDRLYAREVRIGDPLDRMQAAFEGCEIEQSQKAGEKTVYDVHVPYGTRPVHVGPAPADGKPAEVVGENGKAILTYERKVLRFYLVLDPGVR